MGIGDLLEPRTKIRGWTVDLTPPNRVYVMEFRDTGLSARIATRSLHAARTRLKGPLLTSAANGSNCHDHCRKISPTFAKELMINGH